MPLLNEEEYQEEAQDCLWVRVCICMHMTLETIDWRRRKALSFDCARMHDSYLFSKQNKMTSG